MFARFALWHLYCREWFAPLLRPPGGATVGGVVGAATGGVVGVTNGRSVTGGSRAAAANGRHATVAATAIIIPSDPMAPNSYDVTFLRFQG
jgi:hypothetical protein